MSATPWRAIARRRRRRWTSWTKLRAESYASALDLADIHVALGDRERAFRWLDQAADERAFHLIYLKVWPELDPLRPDPRFKALILRLGLEP